MHIDEYRERYVTEMMKQADLSREEAETAYEAIPDEDKRRLALIGDPRDDVLTELSYWETERRSTKGEK